MNLYTFSSIYVSGQKFAMLEMKVILSSIFRHYTVKSLQSREELKPVMELILRPENGIIIELTPRNSTS